MNTTGKECILYYYLWTIHIFFIIIFILGILLICKKDTYLKSSLVYWVVFFLIITFVQHYIIYQTYDKKKIETFDIGKILAAAAAAQQAAAAAAAQQAAAAPINIGNSLSNISKSIAAGFQQAAKKVAAANGLAPKEIETSDNGQVTNSACFALYSEYAQTQIEIDKLDSMYSQKLNNIQQIINNNAPKSNSTSLNKINTNVDLLINNFQKILNSLEKTQNIWNGQYKTTLGSMNSIVNVLDNIKSNLDPKTYGN